MSEASRRNPLVLPLAAVSMLCVVEAVAIAFLLGRARPAQQVAGGPAASPASSAASSSGPSPASSPPPSPTSLPASPPASSPEPSQRLETRAEPERAKPDVRTAPPAGSNVVRGKVGQRAESAGLALTVMKVANEPELGAVFNPPAGQKFVDVDLLLENNTGRRFDYYSTEFTIKDGQDRVYSSGALGVGDPQLSWGQIVNGEKVRGHVAFVVPKDAKGLRLVCPPPSTPADARPIYVDLGQ
jgi:hypothetical protein